MNWLHSRSHHAQLAIAAVSASLATASILTTYHAFERRRRRLELQKEVLEAVARQGQSLSAFPTLDQIPTEIEELIQQRVVTVEEQLKKGDSPDALLREQLARCYAVFKEEGMEKIRSAKVVVVGCGGVGSWTAVMLVRSGVTNIRLIDFDNVTMSSLNRHATATLGDVGYPKVTRTKIALERMSLKVEVDARNALWRKEDGADLLEDMDWVIDAIDNITTKVDLIKHCHSKGIKVISSMGAGSKLDPTRIQISDISCTAEDSLSRAVRVRLRKAGVFTGVPVVYSTEKPEADIKLLPLAEEEREKGNVQELTVFDDFRVRVLPVYGPIPAIFGLNMAAYVVCEIAGKPIANPLWIKNRRKTYEKLLRELKDREEKIAGRIINRLSIDESDIGYIYDDLYRGRSLIPPHNVPSKATLTRWNLKEPLSVRNCVVLDGPELRVHMAGFEKGLKPEEIWGKEIASIYAKRRNEAGEWWEKMMQ